MIECDCFIIAGGRSTRMNSDKLLLNFGNSNLPQYIFSKLSTVFENISIISNSENSYIPKCKVYKDIIQSIGPISGIHSALVNSNTEKIFIIGADIPFFDESAIKYLFEFSKSYDITIFSESGRKQYLFGFYSKKILPVIENMVRNVKIDNKPKVKLSLFDLFENVNSKSIEICNLQFYDKQFFFNINTENDYIDASKILRNKI